MLIEQINQALKQAMLNKDSLQKDLLAGLKSAIGYAKVEKKSDLTDDEIIKILQKEQKKRFEAADLFEKGGNKEASTKEKQEAAIIAEYLPAALGEDEVRVVVKKMVEQIKPAGMQDMGKVIGATVAELGAATDGSLVAKIVKEEIN